MEPVVVIAILLAAGWLFLALPVRRRQRSHKAMQDDVRAGDEIITAGGIHAVVRTADDEQLRVELAPGVVVTLDRRAVAAVAAADDQSHGSSDAGRVDDQNAS